MNTGELYIKTFFLVILCIYSLDNSTLNAKCLCTCVNKKVKIICKDVSDVKPVCMPFKCNSDPIGKIPKIDPPEVTNELKSGCKGTKTIDLSNNKLFEREECQ